MLVVRPTIHTRCEGANPCAANRFWHNGSECMRLCERVVRCCCGVLICWCRDDACSLWVQRARERVRSACSYLPSSQRVAVVYSFSTQNKRLQRTEFFRLRERDIRVCCAPRPLLHSLLPPKLIRFVCCMLFSRMLILRCAETARIKSNSFQRYSER